MKFRLKIFVLIIVLIIWVMHSLFKIHHTEVSIPIVFKNLSEELMVSYESPTHLDVLVEGRGMDIYKFKKSGSYIEVDAHNFSDVSYELNITDNNLFLQDPLFRSSISFNLNEKLEVTFDKIISKEVPVVKRFLTLDDEIYFQRRNATISPSKVMIEGPERVVKAIENITTVPINISEFEQETISAELEIPNNVLGIKPDVVDILFETPTTITRTIPLIDIEYTTDENINIIPQYVTVKIEGTAEIVQNIRAASIKAYADIPANYEYNFAPISFKLPEGVTLLEYSPRRVQIIRIDD